MLECRCTHNSLCMNHRVAHDVYAAGNHFKAQGETRISGQLLELANELKTELTPQGENNGKSRSIVSITIPERVGP